MEAAVFYSLIPQKICQFKAENSETIPNPLCLRNISTKFTANNVRKKTILILVILSIFINI